MKAADCFHIGQRVVLDREGRLHGCVGTVVGWGRKEPECMRVRLDDRKVISLWHHSYFKPVSLGAGIDALGVFALAVESMTESERLAHISWLADKYLGMRLVRRA